MQLSLNVASILLTIFGGLSILIGSLYNEIGGGDLTKPWHKRRWWHVWRPFYKNTQTLKWRVNWDRIIIHEGFISLKVKFEVLGFLLIVIGGIFQLL